MVTPSLSRNVFADLILIWLLPFVQFAMVTAKAPPGAKAPKAVMSAYGRGLVGRMVLGRVSLEF